MASVSSERFTLLACLCTQLWALSCLVQVSPELLNKSNVVFAILVAVTVCIAGRLVFLREKTYTDYLNLLTKEQGEWYVTTVLAKELADMLTHYDRKLELIPSDISSDDSSDDSDSEDDDSDDNSDDEDDSDEGDSDEDDSDEGDSDEEDSDEEEEEEEDDEEEDDEENEEEENEEEYEEENEEEEEEDEEEEDEEDEEEEDEEENTASKKRAPGCCGKRRRVGKKIRVVNV